MSRIPQPQAASSRTRSPLKPPTAPSRAGATTPNRTRTNLKTTPTGTPVRTRTKSTPTKPPVKDDAPPPLPTLSVKEAIALKRAEAKKAQKSSAGGGLSSFAGDLEDAVPTVAPVAEEEDLLGRLSVRETIERGRSTGESY